ncbi:MAG: ribonuclease P protein component [Actinomycetota bacterium]|nr:ribonuclease P protein component [Actinomycetota bacterium]
MIWRISRRQTFLALRQGRHLRAGPLRISWVAGSPDEPLQVAYTIGKRVGSAVERNRLRRRLRMLFREAAPQLPPGAYLIGATSDANHLDYDDLRTILMRALGQLDRR